MNSLPSGSWLLCSPRQTTAESSITPAAWWAWTKPWCAPSRYVVPKKYRKSSCSAKNGFYRWDLNVSVCVFPDPEAVWEESKVPVRRDELGPARHSTANSPNSKETMKDKRSGREGEFCPKCSRVGLTTPQHCRWENRGARLFSKDALICLSFNSFIFLSASELITTHAHTHALLLCCLSSV